MVCTMNHTWSVQQNIPSSAQCMHLWLPAKQNTPGLYNKTYLVCTVAASGCQYNNIPGLYSGCQWLPVQQHTWSVQWLPVAASTTTYLVCTVAASTTTYLVCTVAASTTTKHTWSVQWLPVQHTWSVQWLPVQQQNIPGLYSGYQYNNKTYLVCTVATSTTYLVCTVAASTTTKHTWSVQWLPVQQQNIPGLYSGYQYNIPGLYSGCQYNNKTYLVCTVATSTTTKHTWSVQWLPVQQHTWSVQWLPVQQQNIPGLYSGYQYNNIPGLYSGCQYNNKTYLVCTVATSTTYLVCTVAASTTTKHTWSVQWLPVQQQNIPGLYSGYQYNIPGLYSGCQYNNKTYLVCTVATSTTTKHTWSVQWLPVQHTWSVQWLPVQQHTWSVQWLPVQQQNIPGLYSGYQYNNKTYLVCTVATSTTTKHTWSVQSVHLWLSKQNPRDTAVRHDWVLWADDVLVFHFTRFAASQRQWQCNDSDLG